MKFGTSTTCETRRSTATEQIAYACWRVSPRSDGMGEMEPFPHRLKQSRTAAVAEDTRKQVDRGRGGIQAIGRLPGDALAMQIGGKGQVFVASAPLWRFVRENHRGPPPTRQ